MTWSTPEPRGMLGDGTDTAAGAGPCLSGGRSWGTRLLTASCVFFFPTGTLTSMTTLRFMVGSSGLLPVHEQAAAVVQVLNPSAGSSRHGPRAPSPGLVPRHWYRGLPSNPLLFPCFPSHRSWDLPSLFDFFLPWDIPFFLTGPHRSPCSSTPSYMDFSTPFPFSACSLPLQVAPWTPLRCP